MSEQFFDQVEKTVMRAMREAAQQLTADGKMSNGPGSIKRNLEVIAVLASKKLGGSVGKCRDEEGYYLMVRNAGVVVQIDLSYRILRGLFVAKEDTE